jgi:hypothetical protein
LKFSIDLFFKFPIFANESRISENLLKSKGLTNGISATEFGSDDVMSAEMYVTFLLRSLGYDDTKGDFNWEDSLSKAKSIGMVTSTTPYTTTTFIRSHIAKLSYDALLTLYKNSPTSLAQYLVNIGALIKENGVIFKRHKTMRKSCGYPVHPFVFI